VATTSFGEKPEWCRSRDRNWI